MAKIGQKNFLVEVYDKDFTQPYENLIGDARVDGFTASINGGLGELRFTLERSMEDWNDAALPPFDLNKIIRVLVQDTDANTPTPIFCGYISNVHFEHSRDKKLVQVSVLGFISKLSMDIYRSGTTSTQTASAADPSNIFRTVVDSLRDVSNGGNIPFLNYDSAPATPTVEDTGLSVSYSFRSMTFFEALEECRKLAPPFWYWRIGADNKIYFKGKPATATHNLGLGNISSLKIDYGMDELRNGVLIWDKDVAYRYLEDSNSVTQYGRRIKRMIAPNADDNAALDKIALAKIGELKDPRARIRAKVVDNNEWENINSDAGYDIESLQVGDTVSISGFSADAVSEILNNNMMIVRVEYTPTYAIIELELPSQSVSDYLLGLKKEKDESDKIIIPSTYTVV